jgi:hypothetical protein
MLHQVLQQQELLGGEPDLLPIEQDLMTVRIDGDRSVADHRRHRPRQPAQQGRDARRQLPRAERLGHVIVGAELEA